MPSNPFRPAEQVAPKIKCLIYGPSGVGKTYLALTSPGPIAVIDTEGGTAFYANRAGLSNFDVLPTKTFNDVMQAIAYLAANPGYETLVIDPVTVLYETLQDAAQVRRARVRNDKDADLEMLDWNQIKRAYKSLMTDLINLPIHVIVTARERDETVKQGREFVKIGVRPDAEKSTPYYFDTIVRLAATKTARAAILEKDRTGVHPLNSEVSAPSFDKLFGKVIKAGKDATAERSVQSDTDAAETDSETTFADGRQTALPRSDDGGLIGIASTQGTSDFNLRETPDGKVLPFRVKEGRAGQLIIAHDELAETLAVMRDEVLDKRVTVWGTFRDMDIPGKGTVTQVMDLTKIRTADWTLPAPSQPVVPLASAGAPASVPATPDDDLSGLPLEWEVPA
jgi:hypothetical protein